MKQFANLIPLWKRPRHFICPFKITFVLFFSFNDSDSNKRLSNMFPLKKVIPFYCKSRIKCFCEKGFQKRKKEFSLQNRNKKVIYFEAKSANHSFS